jgi:hypothetical protein
LCGVAEEREINRVPHRINQQVNAAMGTTTTT